MKIDITLSKQETVSIQFTNWVGTGQCGNLPTLVVSWRLEFKRGFKQIQLIIDSDFPVYYWTTQM